MQTANEADKVAQLRNQQLSPFKAMFLATLGGAQALSLEDKSGSFDLGKKAGFVALNPQSTSLMNLRNREISAKTLETLSNLVFYLAIMDDDLSIAAAYIMGEKVEF